MNAEQKLKKIVGGKLSQAGFNPAPATDEILNLFRAYLTASDEDKETVYIEGEKKIKNLLIAQKAEEAEVAANASSKKALRFKATE